MRAERHSPLGQVTYAHYTVAKPVYEWQTGLNNSFSCTSAVTRFGVLQLLVVDPPHIPPDPLKKPATIPPSQLFEQKEDIDFSPHNPS